MDILLIAEELESMPADGTRVPGFRRKVLVDVDRLKVLAEELRNSVPADLQEAKEILNQKESIFNLAHLEAQRIRNAGEEEASEVRAAALEEHRQRVSESSIVNAAHVSAQEIKDEAEAEAHEVVQNANRRASLILDEAELAASSRREGADRYSGEILFNLEEQLAEVLGQIRRGIDSLRVKEQTQEAEDRVPA